MTEPTAAEFYKLRARTSVAISTDSVSGSGTFVKKSDFLQLKSGETDEILILTAGHVTINTIASKKLFFTYLNKDFNPQIGKFLPLLINRNCDIALLVPFKDMNCTQKFSLDDLVVPNMVDETESITNIFGKLCYSIGYTYGMDAFGIAQGRFIDNTNTIIPNASYKFSYVATFPNGGITSGNSGCGVYFSDGTLAGFHTAGTSVDNSSDRVSFGHYIPFVKQYFKSLDPNSCFVVIPTYTFGLEIQTLNTMISLNDMGLFSLRWYSISEKKIVTKIMLKYKKNDNLEQFTLDQIPQLLFKSALPNVEHVECLFGDNTSIILSQKSMLRNVDYRTKGGNILI